MTTSKPSSVLYKLAGDGELVAATEADVLSALGRINSLKRTRRGGARVWAKHSDKAGSRCRCKSCNAARVRREQVFSPPPEPARQPDHDKRRPGRFAVRSKFMGG